jgi:hypothetical protein
VAEVTGEAAVIPRSERSRFFGERLREHVCSELRRADYVKRCHAIDDVRRGLDALERETLRTMPIYLRWQTPQHRRLKAAVHARDGHRCRVCGSTRRLRLHHNRYDRVGHPREIEDCETRCETCHGRTHRPMRRGVHRQQLRLDEGGQR